MRTFTLLYPVLGWFAGCLLAFFLNSQFDFLLYSLLGLFLGLFSLSIVQEKPKRFRITSVVVISVLIGVIHFHLNDYRNFQPRNLEGVFAVKIEEAKFVTSETQMLRVNVQQTLHNGKYIPTDYSALITVGNVKKAYVVDDRLMISASFLPIENKGNPGEFNAKWYYLTKGVSYRAFLSSNEIENIEFESSLHGMFTRWRNYLSELLSKHLDGDFLGIAQALLLGDKDNLTDDVMKSFSNTGAMHVLAVSGLHVGLLLIVLNAILQKFSRFLNKRNALLISILLIWVYGFVTGASPAVMRSVFMFSVVAFGQLLGRKSSGMISLFVSALVLSLIDPWVLFDIGFQLSFLAMLGVFLLYPKIKRLIQVKNKALLWFWDGNAVGLAATAFTTPLTLYYFYQFPNYFLLANIGVMVFGFLVLLGGIIFLISSPVPIVSTIVALLFCFCILGLLLWVEWVEQLPGSISGGFHLNILQLLLGLALVTTFSLVLHAGWNRYLWLGVALLVLWISVNRFVEIDSSEVVILNSNELEMVIKTTSGAVGIYTPRFGHANKTPRGLIDYQRYSGLNLKIQSITENTRLKVGNDQLIIKKKRFGYSILLDNKERFYQTYGEPIVGKSVIYNLKLFKYIYNRVPKPRKIAI